MFLVFFFKTEGELRWQKRSTYEDSIIILLAINYFTGLQPGVPKMSSHFPAAFLSTDELYNVHREHINPALFA